MSSGLRQRALRALAQRDHSRSELARKLEGHGTDEEIASLLADLEHQGLLSDVRFAESFVASRARRFGSARLRFDLRRKGVDESLIEQTTRFDRESEMTRAREVWLRKFAQVPGDPREYGRQARFLQNRGFSADIINRLLRGREE